MPNLPDIPGKGLIAGTTNRTRAIVGAAGAGALAVGGLVAKRVIGHHGGDGDDGATKNADPIAETPTAPPGAEKKPVPKPKPAAAKPKAKKPKAAAKPAKAKAEPEENAKPAPKPKAAKPPKAAGTDAGGKDPHHALNNPVVDEPDLTEYPDPYDTREDPRDPADPDGAPFGEEPHPQTGSESTSEPPLSQDPEVPDGGKPPRRDNLDD